MLFSSASLISCPVLSLHVGGQIATVSELIIDPNNLKLIACRVEGPLVGREHGEILPMDSVREFSRVGMIIDSADEFVEPDEIIRIHDVLELHFALKGLKVVTKKGTRLGKVTDYVLNPETWDVQQIIVQRPIMKALMDPELTITRSQVVSIDDYKITVKDEEEKIRAKTNKEFTPSFVNPFRKPDFAAESETEN